jgi:4-carboxymuconolactone decarboxylase
MVNSAMFLRYTRIPKSDRDVNRILPSNEKNMADKPTFGRYTEIPLDQMSAEQRKAYEYVMNERDACIGPYKIWVEHPPVMDLIVPVGVYYKKHSSLIDSEREIVILLTVAKWGAVFAVSDHERISSEARVYSDAGLPAEKVERMIIGLPVSFDNPREQVIYEVASALINSRYVPKGLYDRAVKLLSNNGITDLTVLIGYYTMVALTLMFHDIPAYAEGMQR